MTAPSACDKCGGTAGPPPRRTVVATTRTRGNDPHDRGELAYLRADRANLIHELATRDDCISILEYENAALRRVAGLPEGVPL